MKPTLRPYLDHIIIAALVLACYVFFFQRLGGVGFIGPDEPRYAAIAREMLLTGDYVTPRLYGEPWFEKPVLMYWLAAAGYKLFGINEAGARFPSAAGAALCVFLIYWCGRRLWNRETGFVAGLILATSIGCFAFARAASMDMLLTTCLTMALAFFLTAWTERDDDARRRWFNAFYAALGFGVLVKGPVAVLLPALSLGFLLLLRGKRDEWKSWHPAGLCVTAAVAAPWFILCAAVNGWTFLRTFLITHNIERFATPIFGHDRPLFFFFPVLMLLAFPWTFLLISVLRRSFAGNELLLGLWAAAPFLFFSFSRSKLPGYILPMIPPLALLVAKEILAPSSRVYRIAVFIEAGALAFIGVAFGFYGNTLNLDAHVSGELIMTVTFIMAGVLVVIALWLKPVFLAAFNVIAMAALVITATTMVFPRFDATDTMRPWASALDSLLPPGETVFMYKPTRWAEYGLQYYRFNHVKTLASRDELVGAATKHSRVLCIAEDSMLVELSRAPAVDLEVVESIGKQTAFWAWKVQ